MKIADEIREKVVQFGANVVKVAGKYQNREADIKQVEKEIESMTKFALKEILKLKVKLPAKKENQAVSEYYSGYNQALEDVTKLNEE